MAVHREEDASPCASSSRPSSARAYEGDDDGNAWLERWRARVQPRLVRAIFEQLRAEPGFAAVPVSRGRNPEDELEIAVRFEPGAGGASQTTDGD